jgi:hypothetical protein
MALACLTGAPRLSCPTFLTWRRDRAPGRARRRRFPSKGSTGAGKARRRLECRRLRWLGAGWCPAPASGGAVRRAVWFKDRQGCKQQRAGAACRGGVPSWCRAPKNRVRSDSAEGARRRHSGVDVLLPRSRDSPSPPPWRIVRLGGSL